MKANEKTANGETPGASSSTAGHLPGTGDDSQDVNEEHLQQLVDMGFTRQHARNALLNTATIEQATEYVLTRAHAPTSGNQVSKLAELRFMTVNCGYTFLINIETDFQ